MGTRLYPVRSTLPQATFQSGHASHIVYPGLHKCGLSSRSHLAKITTFQFTRGTTRSALSSHGSSVSLTDLHRPQISVTSAQTHVGASTLLESPVEISRPGLANTGARSYHPPRTLIASSSLGGVISRLTPTQTCLLRVLKAVRSDFGVLLCIPTLQGTC